MYKIYMLEYSQVDNTLVEGFPILVYDDESSDISQKLVSPVLTLEDNVAGSLTFTMTEDNAGYQYVKMFKSTFVVKRRLIIPDSDGEEYETIWEGRAISESRDFYNQKTITCEGALAYLNDIYVFKWEELAQYPTKDYEYNNKKIQFKAIFKYLLNSVNNNAPAVEYFLEESDGDVQRSNIVTQIIRTYDRRIFIDDDDIASYYGESIFDFSSDYETIFDYIHNAIIDRHGGHVKVVKRRPTDWTHTAGMDYDPTDVNPIRKKALCFEYVEEYYSLDLGNMPSSKSYSAGEHVVYQNKVYKFIKDHAAGTSFNIDEVEQIPRVKVISVELKKNLMNLVKETDGSDICTAVLVTGGRNERYTRDHADIPEIGGDDMHKLVFYREEDAYLPDLQWSRYVWLKGNNDGASTLVDHQLDERIRTDFPMIRGFSIVKASGPLTFEWEPVHYADIQPFYVINNSAVTTYGFIAKQISVNFSVEKNEDPAPGEYKYNYDASPLLYQAGVDYLKAHGPDYYSVEVSAIDMNFIDPDAAHANVGDIVYVVSPIHNLSKSTYFLLTKMTIPLDSPESATFTLNRRVDKRMSSIVRK